jgi:hypothetical protein
MQVESLKGLYYHEWRAESEAAAGSRERYPGFLISECFRMPLLARHYGILSALLRRREPLSKLLGHPVDERPQARR